MISLICMSTHKAMAARCLSYHQATSGQPAIQALAMAPLRRLALSVLFTITTNSYQTTCAVSERTFNKRQHPMQGTERGGTLRERVTRTRTRITLILYNFPESSTFCEIFTFKFHSVYADCQRLWEIVKDSACTFRKLLKIACPIVKD